MFPATLKWVRIMTRSHLNTEDTVNNFLCIRGADLQHSDFYIYYHNRHNGLKTLKFLNLFIVIIEVNSHDL